MKIFKLLILLVFAGSCAGTRQPATYKQDGFVRTASGLQYKILIKGAGDSVRVGQEVLLFETTSYRDGTVLYSNENSSRPVKVLIGGNQATDAVDEGLRGMQVGEVRQLIAPANLVKRKSYPPNVSPDSALMIKIILHKIL